MDNCTYLRTNVCMPFKSTIDYRDVCVEHAGGLHQQSWQANRAELESRLASSQAEWKLVVGHHPVLSSGGDILHGSRHELVTHIQPLLEKYGVQVSPPHHHPSPPLTTVPF